METPAASQPPSPTGEVVIRTLAMPADTNANGDVFGGWLMSQMDLGGAILARETAGSRVVTVAVDAMSFVAPVFTGDVVTCYASVDRVGRTSMRIKIEAWVHRFGAPAEQRVTHGIYTYVAIDDHGQPQPVQR
ncbi:acyl-CoA thioester hydrolase YciA [Horticoccus luteus]|uniref:Acyl-CoA thioester hydrolase YciA n=1 Tax=Horticoccus luteus TaxID=2862869 RepID=A0A8F9TX93_9BACT|nr:acyl-CoA thioester hydrolase YciA [Horticoccus luteus]QYM79534.1 acyl-CoA thioester hydrolase YciA [Horticoccus luteus]